MRYAETLKAAMHNFANRDPDLMALAKGGTFDSVNSMISLPYLGFQHSVSYPSGLMVCLEEMPGGPLTEEEGILMLQYLSETDHFTKPRSPWLSFIQLEGGELHAALFDYEAAMPLASAFGEDIGVFLETASRFGGKPLEMADAAVALEVYPNVHLAVEIWAQDEEFPARATILMDSGSCWHLPTASLYMLGIEVSRRLRTGGSK